MGHALTLAEATLTLVGAASRGTRPVVPVAVAISARLFQTFDVLVAGTEAPAVPGPGTSGDGPDRCYRLRVAPMLIDVVPASVRVTLTPAEPADQRFRFVLELTFSDGQNRSIVRACPPTDVTLTPDIGVWTDLVAVRAAAIRPRTEQ
jgi:hypothetical protein